MNKPFDADQITRENWEGFCAVRKKPIIVYACQMNLPEGFRVTTHEGELIGKPGDWLMIGVRGEKYPISDAIFRETYDFVEEENKTQLKSENTELNDPGNGA